MIIFFTKFLNFWPTIVHAHITSCFYPKKEYEYLKTKTACFLCLFSLLIPLFSKNFKIRFGFQKRGRVSKSFRLQKEFFLEEILCLFCRHLTSNYLPTSTAFLIFLLYSRDIYSQSKILVLPSFEYTIFFSVLITLFHKSWEGKKITQ